MGLLDFNITEIASRMVRGAGVRGRIRPTLDDGIVPVARVIDYSRAPYRLDEQKYFGCVAFTAAAAGDGAELCFLNKGTKPVVLEWWRVQNRTAAAIRVTISVQTRAIIDALLQAGGDVALTCYENAPLPATIRNDLVIRNMSTVAGVFPVGGNVLDTVDMVSNATGGGHVDSPVGLDLVVYPGTGIVWSGSGVTERFSLAVQVRVVNNTTIP